MTDYQVPEWIEVAETENMATRKPVITVQHATKGMFVQIDATDMTEDERQRAVTAAVVLLERHPVNRQQRRAQR